MGNETWSTGDKTLVQSASHVRCTALTKPPGKLLNMATKDATRLYLGWLRQHKCALRIQVGYVTDECSSLGGQVKHGQGPELCLDGRPLVVSDC